MLSKWPYIVVFFAILGVVIFLLYRQGLAVSKSICAAFFALRPKRNSDQAALDSCSGWVRHTGRFHESRVYQFFLDARLSKGTAQVLLLDKDKRQLLKLNGQLPEGKIELDRKAKYYLHWEFKEATGKCELRW